MWSTALPPAPPTPTTLITGPAACSFTISNIFFSLPVGPTSKIPLKPVAHPPEYRPDGTALLGHAPLLQLGSALEQQPHRGGIARAAHHFGQSAAVARHADAHGHV